MFIKILSKFEYLYLKGIEKDYYVKCSELANLNQKMRDSSVLLKKVMKKLHGTKTVVYDIEDDRDGRVTFICVQDLRTPSLNGDNNLYMKGDMNIFVMNERIYSSDCVYRFIDMPHLQATFYMNHIRIDELHSCINSISYENKGYGTMMLNTLIEIGKNSGCVSIGGCLSVQDAKTDEKRDNRNRFYLNRGFKLSFEDKDKTNGSISLEIN